MDKDNGGGFKVKGRGVDRTGESNEGEIGTTVIEQQ